MPCFKPLTAFRTLKVNPSTGRRSLTFNPIKALREAGGLKLPCGQCIGCREDRAHNWAIRCSHEAKLSSASCFLTLTYADEHCPQDYSVKKRELQLFMGRVRDTLGPGKRFFGCGEYGEEDGRPHYHVLGFNFDFSADRKFHRKRGDHHVFRSAELEKLWPYGFSEIGSVTAASAGYCAQYCVKKRTGAEADSYYLRRSPLTGDLHQVEPEFSLMSRRPGIGTAWFDRFASDAFPSDFIVVDGRMVRPPKFYLDKLPDADSVEPSSVPEGRLFRSLAAPAAAKVKRKRKLAAAKPQARANSTPDRLAVREFIKLDRRKRLVRSL